MQAPGGFFWSMNILEETKKIFYLLFFDFGYIVNSATKLIIKNQISLTFVLIGRIMCKRLFEPLFLL